MIGMSEVAKMNKINLGINFNVPKKIKNGGKNET